LIRNYSRRMIRGSRPLLLILLKRSETICHGP
jgi:hypothetical protein